MQNKSVLLATIKDNDKTGYSCNGLLFYDVMSGQVEFFINKGDIQW
jgi:hypothetical protein